MKPTKFEKRNSNIYETFGCKLNSFETENLKSFCEQNNFRQTTVVNSCAVTAEAVRKTTKFIRKTKRENPENEIIVTGCAAQTEPQTFAEMHEVGLVVGNSEKSLPNFWQDLKRSRESLKRANNKVLVGDIMRTKKITAAQINGVGTRSRAYVQIQNGCNHRCTFCVIPFGRGNSRSLNAEQIIEQIDRLVKRGFNEVVLTGVDITCWGQDLYSEPRLGTLVKEILSAIPKLARLRISSIDSVEIDESLLNIIINEERFMPHLHLSIQSGDNLILKRMKRRHSREETINFCKTIRNSRPETVFGADIIVGFPTETEKMFRNTLDLVSECKITWLHVFPFSSRKGTPASRMPKVKPEAINSRARALRLLGTLKVEEYLKTQTSKFHSVLMETTRKGRTETFAEVLTDKDCVPGQIVNTRIYGHNGRQLFGAVLAC